MILPDFILPSRVSQRWQYSGIDSYSKCVDRTHFNLYPHDINYVYNSRGFRDHEWPLTLSELQQSIWCIGDSFTVGIGSPVEHTWANILSKQLNKRTINVGMDGASNYWITRKAIDIINTISPGLLIIQWSYLHRSENNDTTLTDEERREVDKKIDQSDQELLDDFIKLIQQVESSKQNTRVIHSFIPESGIKHDLPEVWKAVSDPSWPSCPQTLSEFKNLNSDILVELDKVFNLYDKFNSYYTLFHNIEYVPEIQRIDIARDGHHYDIKTATKFVAEVLKFLN